MKDQDILFETRKTAWIYGKVIFISILFILAFIGGAVGAFMYHYPLIGLILIGVTLIPLLVVIYKFALARRHKIIFYANRVVEVSGIFHVQEKQSAMTSILGVTVTQPFIGMIWNYGSVTVDKVGKWDIDLHDIKSPFKVKSYLETIIQNTDYSLAKQIMSE